MLRTVLLCPFRAWRKAAGDGILANVIGGVIVAAIVAGAGYYVNDQVVADKGTDTAQAATPTPAPTPSPTPEATPTPVPEPTSPNAARTDVSFESLFGQGVDEHPLSDSLFKYVLHFELVNAVKNGVVTISGAENTCDSVHFDFVGTDNGDDDGWATLSVTQSGADKVSSKVRQGTIGSLDATLTPGQPWAVNLEQVPNSLIDFYVNGTAHCATEHFEDS